MNKKNFKIRPKYRPLKECFKKSGEGRSTADLYNDFKKERTDINQLVFYDCLQTAFGDLQVDGSEAYYLEFVSKSNLLIN